MKKNPVVRLLLIAIIYFSVTRLGYGILTAMVVTFFIVLGFNILLWVTKAFNRRRA